MSVSFSINPVPDLPGVCIFGDTVWEGRPSTQEVVHSRDLGYQITKDTAEVVYPYKLKIRGREEKKGLQAHVLDLQSSKINIKPQRPLVGYRSSGVFNGVILFTTRIVGFLGFPIFETQSLAQFLVYNPVFYVGRGDDQSFNVSKICDIRSSVPVSGL